ncbi:MAG: ParA family protein, partial [Desulfobulbia bacterium]
MGQSIAVMNTKGGVGKSTILVALADTLSVYHNKSILVIDSDAQSSTSHMMTENNRLIQVQQSGFTTVGYLTELVIENKKLDWRHFVTTDASDVDDANEIFLIPSHMQLTLLERKISELQKHGELRKSIRELLSEVSRYVDFVFVDCPPGLSVLTESWLRECDCLLSPTKPDYLGICGLEVLRQFQTIYQDLGFAQNLGVLINMMEENSEIDEKFRNELIKRPENNCFENSVPRLPVFQRAAQFYPDQRSYFAKYPGKIGSSLRAVAQELLDRIENKQIDVTSSEPLRSN